MNRSRSGFTIVELLVVIIIITILATVAIPSFSAMMYSQESALAQTRLTAVMRAGRDAAVRSSGDADAGLAFFYEPGGRLTIVPCVKVGVVEDLRVVNGTPTTQRVRRDVFVPVDFIEPVQMPRNFMIRGYTAPGTIDPTTGDWYENHNGQQRYGGSATEGDWVFPETNFYGGGTADSLAGPNVNLNGAFRQTFMVRFQAGTGLLAPPGQEALIVSPRPTGVGRNNAPFGGWRIDQATDLRRFVQTVLQDPMRDPLSGSPAANPRLWRQQLLGDQSSDTVLAKSVQQVALYDENKLATGLATVGVRIDRNSGCMYVLDPLNPYPTYPTPVGATPAQFIQRINQWIEGDTNGDGVINRNPQMNGGRVDDPQARVYTIDRFTGEVRPVEVEQ